MEEAHERSDQRESFKKGKGRAVKKKRCIEYIPHRQVEFTMHRLLPAGKHKPTKKQANVKAAGALHQALLFSKKRAELHPDRDTQTGISR